MEFNYLVLVSAKNIFGADKKIGKRECNHLIYFADRNTL